MKVLGTTEEVTVCDCCGRVDLKKTVAIEGTDGTIQYLGVVCASKLLKVSGKLIVAEAKKQDQEKARNAREMLRGTKAYADYKAAIEHANEYLGVWTFSKRIEFFKPFNGAMEAERARIAAECGVKVQMVYF